MVRSWFVDKLLGKITGFVPWRVLTLKFLTTLWSGFQNLEPNDVNLELPGTFLYFLCSKKIAHLIFFTGWLGMPGKLFHKWHFTCFHVS